MEYIIKDKKLELRYQPGKGAWTYHLCIPNSRQIEGKWGEIKVSGFIDNFKIESRNLAPVTGGDKILSINAAIRNAINKTGGDIVTVTLYLVSNKEKITETHIVQTFKDSHVFKTFENLNEEEKKQIIASIISQKKEEKQIKILIKHIDNLSR